jgi:hypothetical protein
MAVEGPIKDAIATVLSTLLNAIKKKQTEARMALERIALNAGKAAKAAEEADERGLKAA